MSLVDDGTTEERNTDQDSVANQTLQTALTLLESLKPHISQILAPQGPQGSPKVVQVPLERMDIMPPEKGDAERANVLWLGPSKERSAEKKVLWDVCRESVPRTRKMLSDHSFRMKMQFITVSEMLALFKKKGR